MIFKEMTGHNDLIIAAILTGICFSLCFGFSTPSLYLNDEWITVNQVNQLASSGNLLENEGKYGTFFTGEISPYFLYRNNYLAYSLFLPIISLPAVYLILWTGDNFRLIFLFFWGIVGLITLLLIIFQSSKYNMIKHNYLTWGLLFLFFCLFLLNLYYYQPFSTGLNRPIESAAVIFTNEILFALMAPLLYAIFRNLQFSKTLSICGVISILCCSTYFFWSTTAKDHTLVALILIALIYFYSLALSHESEIGVFGLFASSSLLCWARVEYGLIILLGLLVWILLAVWKGKKNQKWTIDRTFARYLIISTAGLCIGLLPFFLNNLIITGNLIIPPQYLYEIPSTNSIYSGSSIIAVESGIFDKGVDYGIQLFSFYTPNVDSLLFDIYGIFISPLNNSVGLLFICPLIFPALLYWFLIKRRDRLLLSELDKKMMRFLIFLILLTLFAYLRTLHASTISSGIFPDMRYYSPLYALLGLLSFIMLKPIFKNNGDNGLKYILIALISVPLLTLIISISLSSGGNFIMYTAILKKLLVLTLIILILYTFVMRQYRLREQPFFILYAVLMMIPATFQFIMVCIFSIAKMNGYSFWLPLLEYVTMNVFQLIY